MHLVQNFYVGRAFLEGLGEEMNQSNGLAFWGWDLPLQGAQWNECEMSKCLPWLLGTYHAQPSQGTEQEKMDYALNNKRRVIRLVLQWAAMYGDVLQEDDVAIAFLEVWGILPSKNTSSSYDRGTTLDTAASLERL